MSEYTEPDDPAKFERYQAEALVNTVNTVGVMGKGIALMFKERFPKNMAAYARACKQKQVRTGKMFVTETGELMGPKWVVNFPTKHHWRNPSKLEWIEEGLEDLRSFIVDHGVKSIAIPPLGAGNGRLEWPRVKREIERFCFVKQGAVIRSAYNTIDTFHTGTKIKPITSFS